MNPSELLHNDRILLARKYLDSAEAWLRKLIHHELNQTYKGVDYLGPQGPINKGIRDRAERRRSKNPAKFLRNIDATTLADLVDIVCNPELFKMHFKVALSLAYPDGHAEARTFLRRLDEIRDDVSHGRGCSVRQLEQAICYSNDLIDSLKAYFAHIGMQKTFNVPSIIQFVDSFGNKSTLENVLEDANSRYIDWRIVGHGDIQVGEILTAEVEIDPSFDQNEYDVSWYIFGAESGCGPLVQIPIGLHHVGEQFELKFTVISKREWHRFFQCDDALGLLYRVPPPIE